MRFFRKSKRKAQDERRMKAILRSYFDNSSVALSSLGITNIEFSHRNREIVMTITLERPGLIVVDVALAIETYMRRRITKPFYISLKHSKIWL